jgi:hypothetical protein
VEFDEPTRHTHGLTTEGWVGLGQESEIGGGQTGEING